MQQIILIIIDTEGAAPPLPWLGISRCEERNDGHEERSGVPLCGRKGLG